MAESKHAPTPWKARKRWIFPDRPHATHEIEAIARADEIADAEFIVRACNAHDDLLAACEATRGVLRSQGLYPATVARLNAAIAKAKEPRHG